MDTKPKLSNFKDLANTLTNYRVVNPKEKETKEEATATFLRRGGELQLPVAVRIAGRSGEPGDERWMPYRIFPTAALESLNASVRFLEYCLQRDNTPDQIEPESRTNPYNDPVMREGALQLATTLIPNCLISPEKEYQGKNASEPSPEDAGGGTLLHRSNPKDPTRPIPTKRAKMLKGLLGRLEKYESIRLATLKTGALETSPELEEIQRLQYLFDQEYKASLNAWKLLRDGLMEKTKSLDDMAYNESQNALRDNSPGDDGYDNPLDQEEEFQDQEQQREYYGEAESSPEMEENSRRRKNLPCEPDGWIWKETTDPMEVITQYLRDELTPQIEQKKEELLGEFQNPAKSSKEKQETLLLLPEKKYNPNDFWKMAMVLTKTVEEESTDESRRLAAARFAICLRETNLEKKVPHGKFLQEWEKTVSAHLDGTKPQASRNHALLSTLKNLEETKNWNEKEINQWIEHLQTLAPGGYENSSSQEKNRAQILQTLNKMMSSLKDGLKKEENQENPENSMLERTLDRISEGIAKSLSGPTGQTVRRELRYHIKALKDDAISRGEKQEGENFGELWKWLTSISSQIKEGSWFNVETQEATKKVVRGMIIDILSRDMSKTQEQTFVCSPSPEGKNEAHINVEFLKAISRDNAKQGFAGRNKIEGQVHQSKDQIQTSRATNLGTTLPTKVWSNEMSIENLPNKVLASKTAVDLLTTLPREEDPLQALFQKAELHLKRVVEGTQNDKEAEETMGFWDAMVSLSENIRMRKERPQFQPSALGRKMIRRCAQMAKENYTGIENLSPQLRESMARNSRRVVLLSNAIAPIGLWIKSPKKGKSQISHEEVVASFKERSKNLEAINNLFVSNTSQDLEKQIKTEIMVAFALNLSVLDETKKFFEPTGELAQSILWQHRNQEAVTILTEKHPEADTPRQRRALQPEEKPKAEPKIESRKKNPENAMEMSS